MKLKIIGCQSVKEEIISLSPNANMEFLNYSLHGSPDKLNQELNKRITDNKEADAILLAYGLCSNAVVGLSGGKQKIVIPAVHDCIAMLLGSSTEYYKKFDSAPDTFYLSRGWIDYGSDPMKEVFQYSKKYGEVNGKWVVQEMYKNYKRIVFIDTGVCSKEHFLYARKVADFMSWEYEEIKGSLDLLKKLVSCQWDEDFIITPPGREIVQSSFFCRRKCNASNYSIT